ncbi:MAG: aldo/keto reductase [Betaproteobacteria bacterium]
MTPPPLRSPCTSRRRALAALAALGTAASLRLPANGQTPADRPLARPIPSSGETLPLVGLGTWITFNVGNDRALREQSTAVMRAFFESGGRLIDSSPMYGSAQDVIGDGLARLGHPRALFAADKVWIGSGARGPGQIEASRQRWRVARFDLLQVHNLLAWQEHLPTLMAMKAEGRLRYVGITTSEGRRHRDFEQIMREHPLDFVQFSYNVLDREAETRLLPLARDRGIAVIVNRPFRQGDLTRALARQPLPGWAAEIGCSTWAQVLLKFILAHPAVTCAIPATSNVEHVRENLAAARGPLPDAAMLERIVAHVEKLA